MPKYKLIVPKGRGNEIILVNDTSYFINDEDVFKKVGEFIGSLGEHMIVLHKANRVPFAIEASFVQKIEE